MCDLLCFIFLVIYLINILIFPRWKNYCIIIGKSICGKHKLIKSSILNLSPILSIFRDKRCHSNIQKSTLHIDALGRDEQRPPLQSALVVGGYSVNDAVCAVFSSWRGARGHGTADLLTEIKKIR